MTDAVGMGAVVASPGAVQEAQKPSSSTKKLLILGGTRFLGPQVIRAAQKLGYEVTLFNRGKSNPDLFANFRKKIARKTRGFNAPEAIVQCVEDAVSKSLEEGLKGERERFVKLVSGDQSAAQRYYFFAERQANKIPEPVQV